MISKRRRGFLSLLLQAKDSWDLEASEKLVAAAKKKEEGNDLFKKGKLFHAAIKYEKVP